MFGDLYEEIFNDERINARILLNLHTIYLPLLQQKKAIQGKKRRKEKITEKEAFISWATFHILYGMKFIFENEDLDPEKDDDRLKSQRKSVNYIFEVVEKEIEKLGDLYTHGEFFKEVSTDRIIKEHILGKYSET